jgi:hypothetical protein
MKIDCLLFILLLPLLPVHAQSAKEEKQLLQLVDEFFTALEKQDTVVFRHMFVKGAGIYAVRELKDSVRVNSQVPSGFKFKPDVILKERMRKASTSVQLKGRIAMVWAPYDLWVNEKFSHCGVDLFSFIKTSSGWKISSISYTVETERCE